MSSGNGGESVISRKRVFIVKAVNVVLFLCLLAVFDAWAYKTAAADAEVEAQIAEAEHAASRGAYATDGTFTGSAQGYGGTVEVEVTIEDGYIVEVEPTSYDGEDEAYWDMCVGLFDQIVSEQTTNIDVVTGATMTSAGILNATTEALQESNAGGDE